MLMLPLRGEDVLEEVVVDNVDEISRRSGGRRITRTVAARSEILERSNILQVSCISPIFSVLGILTSEGI